MATNTTVGPIPQEYFLMGSVLDSAPDGGRPVDVLLHRLRGLADQLDPLTGPVDGVSPTMSHRDGHSVQTFHEHEHVFAMKPNSHAAPLSLRVRRSLDPSHKSAPYHVRYLGTSENEKTKSVMTRQFISVATNDALIPFLEQIGFRLDHEFVIKGFLFRKGRMKIIVSKVYKTMGKVDQLEPLTNSHLVEVSVVAAPGGGGGASDPIGDDMKTFAEMLKPLVNLEKVDARRWT